MKRIFYFHGLQSKQGGEKIDYLTRYNLIYAPKMIYAEPETWPSTIKTVNDFCPQFIIGSSMGGLMSFYVGYNKPNCRLLLFNPAFSMREDYIDKWECQQGRQRAEIKVILGKNDQQVDPKSTIEYLQKYKIKAQIKMIDIQHRIPYQVFVREIQEFLNQKHQSKL